MEKLFTTGRIIFALAFVLTFIITIGIMYWKDLKMHKTYYKGSLLVLIAFLLFIGLLFVIKSVLKH